ncbi:longevity assurance protein [Histomonas meleagridis]|uniref:longevity assurance protein n=1 Tax=Histomonas meleagridis TaxID=135588 RepID=UPI003559C649|nr:longevity assurance protein [Histomonas meleagridis]KAH0806144.1 longevity assurance protein [Histomonas meleagridis]
MSALFNQLDRMTYLSIKDLPTLVIGSAVYLIYRLIMCNFVLNKIGKSLGVKNNFKFTHRSFDMIHYVSSALLGFAALSRRPYFHCIFWAADCVEAFSQKVGGYPMSVLEKIYFMMFACYYIADFFFIHTASEKYMMIVHHIVTLFMIFSCVYLDCPITGILIMLLHDIVDVPLYVGKILLYLGFKTPKDISLVIFAISCTFFRIINFPNMIKNAIKAAFVAQTHAVLYHITAYVLLILYGLHIIWEIKIFGNVVEVLKGSSIHDNRSDKAQ